MRHTYNPSPLVDVTVLVFIYICINLDKSKVQIMEIGERVMKTIMKRKLTYYRVYWNDGCVDDYRPAQYRILMAYKDMREFVSLMQKIRKVVEV